MEQEFSLDKVLYSPRVRARETAEILIEAAGLPPEQTEQIDWIGNSYHPSDLIRELNSHVAESIAVVGHEPLMSECTSRFINGGNILFKPGTIACVEFHGPVFEGSGYLSLLLDPRLFNGSV